MSSLLPTAPARPRPTVAGALAAPAAEHNRLGFYLFLIVNAVLFVRPAEISNALLGYEFYQYLILACLAVSFPAVLARLSPAVFEKQPINVCVAALLPAIVLSLVANSHFAEAWDHGVGFCKVLIYYFLFLALIDSPARLRAFLTWMVICVSVVACLAILDYHEIRPLPRLPPPPGQEMPDEREIEQSLLLKRMVGTGLFQDPNDLCIMFVVSLVLALYRLSDARAGSWRVLWLVPLALFAYGFSRTQSRGGLLALVAALGVLVRLRYGWGKAILFAALAFPFLGVFLGARQLSISTSAETATSRIQLWSSALTMLRRAPVFGVGVGHSRDDETHVAHNAYLTAFSELGLFGGVLFLGAAFLAVWWLYKLTWPAPSAPGQPVRPREVVDPELRAMHPFVAGAVTGYAAGMVTLSLTYVIPTYTMFALAAVFLPMAGTRPATPHERFDSRLVLKLGAVAVGFLIFMQVFVRVFFRG